MEDPTAYYVTAALVVTATTLSAITIAFVVTMALLPLPFGRSDPKVEYALACWAGIASFVTIFAAGILAADPIVDAILGLI